MRIGPAAAESAADAVGRNRREQALVSNFGGVTDRGLRHATNQDAMALALCTALDAATAIMVVCDGVSSSLDAEAASASAAQIASQALCSAVRDGSTDREDAMIQAILAAHAAVCDLPSSAADSSKDPPATTLVAAVVERNQVVLGWVGDSRAYWIGASDARLLTHDHSWINAMVDSGQMEEVEAVRAPEAHAITQCLGRIEWEEPGNPPEPGVGRFSLPGEGHLVLCTDGFWNYAPHPEDLAALLGAEPVGSDALPLARALVEHAIRQGGHDNITVVLLRSGSSGLEHSFAAQAGESR